MNQHDFGELIARRAELKSELQGIENLIQGEENARYHAMLEAAYEAKRKYIRTTPAQYGERILKLRAARFDMAVARIKYLWGLEDFQEPFPWNLPENWGTCANGRER